MLGYVRHIRAVAVVLCAANLVLYHPKREKTAPT